MNTETLGRSIEEKENLTAVVEASGDTPRLSGATRLMQRPTEMQRRSSATAAALGCRGVVRRNKKRRDGGKKEMTLGPIYKVS